MTVGLPGSGIGGIFYLVSALSMPIVAVVRRLRSRETSWRTAAEQGLMALGIVAGLGVTGWLLGLALAQTPIAAWAARRAGDVREIPNVLRAASLLVTLATLSGVIVAVWVSAFLVHGRTAFRQKPRRTESPVQPAAPAIARTSSDR